MLLLGRHTRSLHNQAKETTWGEGKNTLCEIKTKKHMVNLHNVPFITSVKPQLVPVVLGFRTVYIHIHSATKSEHEKD